MRLPINFFICLTVIVIHGCTIFRAPQLRNGETASECFQRIAETNDMLVSCKGIAKISTQGFGSQLHERIAFIAQKAYKLRAEMLSPFGAIGSPFQLICNENRIYLNSRFMDKPYHIQPNAFMLKYALPINIQPHEFIACLHGQLPTLPAMHATFDPQSDQKVLLLSKGLIRRTRQKIYFDSSEKNVRSFEKYNHFNQLIYRLSFGKYQTFNTFSVPSTLTISNAANQSITLDIQSYYPNCAIKKNSFQIEGFEHADKGGFPCLTSWIFNPVQSLLNLF